MRKHLVACLIILSAAILFFSSCGGKQSGQSGIPTEQSGLEYSAYMPYEIFSYHTAESITSDAPIMFSFTKEGIPAEKTGSTAEGCSIDPQVPGRFEWKDQRTVHFVPEKPLKRGQLYTVSVIPARTSEYFPDSTDKLYFTFSLVELSSWMSVDENFTFPGGSDINALELYGSVELNDSLSDEEVEKDLTVSLDGKKIPVKWEHGKLSHRFIISDLKKKDEGTQKLNIEYKAWRFAERTTEHIERLVPQVLSELVVTACEAVESNERYILLSFSSPLLETQDFSGYITMSPAKNLRYLVSGNQLRVYSLDGWPDSAAISVAPGLRDRGSAKTVAPWSTNLTFTSEPPGLRFSGSGVIIPNTSQAVLPVETVNLTGIIVTIEKVYEENLGQFLQVNELSGGNEIHRVGKQVWKKIIPVTFAEEHRNRWITTNLDLSPLFADGNHNLYRVSLSCDVRMSAYPGAAMIPESDLLYHDLQNLEITGPAPGIRQLSDDFWAEYARGRRSDYYDEEYSRMYSGNAYPNNATYFSGAYNYYGRNYSAQRALVKTSRNVLVSNIGLVAQADSTRRLTLAAHTLTDASSLKGATISVRNYQNREIASAVTDANGLVSFADIQDAFLIVAQAGKDRGFLRLQGASNQPVSHFDVSGQLVQQGVKGFIYGERGVWRPGDTIYLTFVLNDTNNVLPANHPAVLTFYDPQGRYRQTVKNTNPVGSFYSFKLATGREDITGTYTATIQVGGHSFSKEIPVETIKPNRLKIELSLQGNPEELGTDSADARIHATWLHGSDAAGLKADVNARFSAMETRFKGYEQFTFDDPIRQYAGESRQLFENTLDSAGKASFTMKLSSGTIAPGKLKATIKTRVFEAGGNMNTDVFSIPFNPYPRYAGISVESTDKSYGWSRNYPYIDITKKNRVKVALVDSEGKGVTSGTVEMSVYSLGWRWWWERGEENLVNYLGSQDYSLIQKQNVEVKNGTADWELDLRDKGELWGRYIIRARDIDSGHTTGTIVYFYYPGWYFRSTEDGNKSPAMLTFSADKTKYTAGETALIGFPSSEGAKILVSIENNGKLVSSEVIPATKGSTAYRLKITEEMTPNIYVHAIHIQPLSQSSNDRPARLYGVIPLDVENARTKLVPVVETAASYEPESTAKISVSEASGAEMTYTLAMVDEGLLNITRFTTPNPWTHFFRRDALAVQTWDMYGFVNQSGFGRNARMLAVGGGEDMVGQEGEKANRFPPMVHVSGPYTLEKGKKAVHEIKMPQYVGAVRLMVVAGNRSAYGSTEKTVPVRKPVMTYSVLPRVMSIGESVNLPISVFALEDTIKKVDVSVKASGALELTGERTMQLAFTKTGDQLAVFALKAAGKAGKAKIEVTASSGQTVSTEVIELDVRVPSPPRTDVVSHYLSPGEKKNVQFSWPGLSGTNSLKIEFSKIYPVDLERRLGYLIQYPYGCIEQTTSAVFPQLFLDKITDLGPQDVVSVRNNIQSAITRLLTFQVANGGLSYWPNSSHRSSYGTVYASHFLFEAESLGYTVPATLKATALRGLKDIAQGRGGDESLSDTTVAYALYDLALAGAPEIGLMNRMKENRSLSAPAKNKLAGAYALIGQKEAAASLIANTGTQPATYTELGGTYGTDTRDMAILVEAYLASGQTELALPLVDTLCKRLSSDRWYGTQTTAYSLLAIGKFLESFSLGKAEEAMNIRYVWNGETKTADTKRPVGTVSLAANDSTQSATMGIENMSKTPLYIRIISTGLPDPMSVTPVSSGLNLTVSWKDKKGNPLDISNLKQGTDIVADVSITNTSGLYLENLALETLMPSGWEITNPRFEGWSSNADSTYDYQDIRDDRVYTFFNMKYFRSQEKRFRFLMTASYEGTFYLPVFKVSAMYDNAYIATTGAQWVTVSPDSR